jgi:predicted small metal-binding protein
MYRCKRPGCGWQSIAPSEEAAFDQYVEHLVEEHAERVDADVPEGMVQVRFGESDEWRTVTPEEAHRLHREHHGGE